MIENGILNIYKPVSYTHLDVYKRQAYICSHYESCLQKAFKKKAFERTFSTAVSQEQKEELIRQLEEIKGKNEG